MDVGEVSINQAFDDGGGAGAATDGGDEHGLSIAEGERIAFRSQTSDFGRARRQYQWYKVANLIPGLGGGLVFLVW